jgi:HAE1 family hydrophobic/amphiphilic exporter-1
VGAAALVALGTFALLRLPVALLPDLERPRLHVVATASDRSREEMLRGFTEPAERRLGQLAGVRSIRSETEDGLSTVVVEAEWQVDADRLRIDAARLVEGAGDVRPDRLDIRAAGGDVEPIAEVAVQGGEGAAARTAFATDVLAAELARLPGAGRIEIVGRTPLHVVVRPRASALAARGLSAGHVAARLDALGQAVAAGRVADGAVIRPLLVREVVTSLDELRQVRVPTARGGTPLDDLAAVALEEVSDGTSFRKDGEPGVLVRVFRAPGANAIALAARVRDRVVDLGRRAGSGLRLEVVRDRSGEVVSALAELGASAFSGILLGTLVLWFVLRRFTPTLALAVVIPASMLGSFVLFELAGVPLDVVSLAGLALAAGILVDNSIVVLESIESARAQAGRDAPLVGTQRVAVAVLATCITTVVVFVPLLYLRGLARAFFGEQAFAVVVSLLVSLLLSFTLTPVLAGHTAPLDRPRNPGLAEYRTLLDAALRRPVVPLVAASALVGVTALALPLLPRELFPESDARAVRVHYRLPPDLSRDEMDRRGREVEEAVTRAGVGRVRSVLAVRGVAPASSEGVGAAVDPSWGRIDVLTVDAEAARSALHDVRTTLAMLPDVTSRAVLPPSAFVEALGTGGSRIDIVLSAADETRLAPLTEVVVAAVERETGRTPRAATEQLARAALVLRWDEPRLAALGASRESMEAQARSALDASEHGAVEMPDVEPAIRLESVQPEDLATVPLVVSVPGPPGEPPPPPRAVPLPALARWDLRARESVAVREEGRPARRLVIDDETHAVNPLALARVLEALPLSADERVRLGGQALEMQRSFRQLWLALALSLVLAYLTVAALYESLTLPLLVFATVPVAAAGSFGLLALTGQGLNVMTIIGLIVLGGIVIDNAIVLVDRIESLLAEGQPWDAAVRGAASERYRPILMTTATTLIGMLPLAILPGEGAVLRRALAITVIGGLTTSTVASLVVVPVLHRWLRRPAR